MPAATRSVRTRLAAVVAAASALGGAAIGAGASANIAVAQRVLTATSVHNDVSAPLRDMRVTWPTRPGFAHEPPESTPSARPKVADRALQTSATNSSALK